jgi:hypothetical protein
MKVCGDKFYLSLTVHQQIGTKEHSRLAGQQEPVVDLLRPRRVDRL